MDRVDSSDQRYGLASLNLTKVTEKDRGWYNCKVLFLDRGPDASVVCKIIDIYIFNYRVLNNKEFLNPILYENGVLFFNFRMVHGIILMYMQNPILSRNLTTLYT